MGTLESAGAFDKIKDMIKEDNKRLLRVVYWVKDLEMTIKFYTECLGMKLLEKHDHPLEKCTSAFLGYGPRDTHFIVELKFYHGISEFNLGTGFGHIGINVEDIFKSLALIKSKGGKVVRDALQVKGASTICAFVEDPNGYEIELLQRSFHGDPFCQVMLRVLDLDHAIAFYKKAFGMQTLRTLELQLPGTKWRLAFLGYGPEDKTTVLELNSIFGVTEYDKGNTYVQLVIGTNNIDKMSKTLQEFGGEITQELDVQGNSTKTLSILDPNGWKLVFVKNVASTKDGCN